MPFGLVNSTATFQAMMNTILRELLNNGVVVLLRRHSHLFRKQGRIYRAGQEGASTAERLGPSSINKKSVFQVNEVEFLGYIVAVDWVTMNE